VAVEEGHEAGQRARVRDGVLVLRFDGQQAQDEAGLLFDVLAAERMEREAEGRECAPRAHPRDRVFRTPRSSFAPFMHGRVSLPSFYSHGDAARRVDGEEGQQRDDGADGAAVDDGVHVFFCG